MSHVRVEMKEFRALRRDFDKTEKRFKKSGISKMMGTCNLCNSRQDPRVLDKGDGSLEVARVLMNAIIRQMEEVSRAL